nr:MAG TPA: hypothetical protein [Caudoviricetes sp.]
MGDSRDRPTPALPGPRPGPPSTTKAPHQTGGAPSVLSTARSAAGHYG